MGFLKTEFTQLQFSLIDRRLFAAMDQRLSAITLGVKDLTKAREFYEKLGWQTTAKPGAPIVFFQAGGMIIALWGADQLASDSGIKNNTGTWSGITLAQCVKTPADVDAVLKAVVAAGGTIQKPAEKKFWGGYSGMFADLDGHAWEVAHNPLWTLSSDGTVHL